MPNMLYVYGFCDGSATAAVEEYRPRFLMRRIPDRRVFSKVFNTLRECDNVETNFQRRFSINVWCGMIDDMFIGPVILNDHMTGQNYLDFL